MTTTSKDARIRELEEEIDELKKEKRIKELENELYDLKKGYTPIPHIYPGPYPFPSYPNGEMSYKEYLL